MTIMRQDLEAELVNLEAQRKASVEAIAVAQANMHRVEGAVLAVQHLLALVAQREATVAELQAHQQAAEENKKVVEQLAGVGQTAPVPTIDVNGKSFAVVPGEQISYADVCRMAGFDGTKILTVTHCSKDGNTGGSLTPGESVQVADGVRFTVADTSAA